MDSHNDVLFATAGYDHTIRFWQAQSGLAIRTLQHPDSQVNCLAFTPDRAGLAAAGHQHIRMYDVNSNNPNPVVNYDGITKNVMQCGFHTDGLWMYTAGEDKTAKIWDLRSSRMQCQRMFQVESPINAIALHPNQGELIVGDQSGALHLWDLRTDHNEQLIPEPDASIQSINVDPDARYMAAINNKGACYIWSLSNGTSERVSTLKPKTRVAAHKKYGLKCLFSPDSCLLATTSADATVKIWNTADFSLRTTLETEGQRWVWDCAFSADSQYLVTASSDGNARLWNVEDGDVRRAYTGHQKAIVTLAFHDSSPA